MKKKKLDTSRKDSNGIVLLLLTLGLFLFSGCLHDSDDDDSSRQEQNLPEENIVEIASGDESFSTLVTAITAAELGETLSGEGPFTVFAPTNAAFSALPEGTVDALLADPKGDLTNILLYHVVSGEVKAEQVVTLDKATTVFGKDVAIEVKDGKVYLNGTTMVTSTDIMASNGIIHVIDAVLIPH